MFGWRLIPEDMLDIIKEENRELRNTIEGLMDRMLLGQGHLPLQPELKAEVTEAQSKMSDELRELLVDEVDDKVVDSKAGGK
ncbi:hypothetical protein LCGC14_2562690 [marine sediment metagenome]|uniref:Uncharacterized protein n=1 Tax=marine sediment metagenome TaxID=412755 RepID=A0A0F9AK70_9ZZZZ